ncbi:MAG TPA: hypothetical protein VFI51_07400 [Bradyrhizobium sp.]|nr:hypothetical protein [Bradyrhizobium sp.]
MEARTAFRAPEPDARLEVAVGRGARQAAAVAVVPDAQPEAEEPGAAVAAEPGAQPEAAVAVSDAQREAVVAPDVAVAAEPDAQQAVAAASGAQREATAVGASGAQQEAAVAAVSDAQRALEPPAVARLLAASVEPPETAAVRFWFRATTASAVALERRVASAAKVQAAVDR